MKKRERILNALLGREVDRLPWTPLIDSYFIRSLPEQGIHLEIIQAMRYIGCDIMERHVAGAQFLFHNVERRTNTWENRSRTIYETPVGSICEERGRTRSTEYVTKHLIETLDDIKVMQYIAEHTDFASNAAAFAERDAYIGDDGIATVSLTPTPIQELLQQLAGVENTVYLMADYGEEMDALLHALHERNKRQCQILCEYPTPVIFQYEDTSTTVMNTCMLSEYELPCINDYAAIFHESGKRFITHMCGKLDGFKNRIGEADMDGVDSVCPPTTGDLWPWEARAAFGEKVIIGGIEPPGLARKTMREVLGDVAEILRRMPTLQSFLLSTGDAVPFGTPIENLIAVTRFIELLGHRSLTGAVTQADVEMVLSRVKR